MEILGLIFECLFLALGLFVYAFAKGKIAVHSTERPLVERFRRENKNWMAPLGLLLTAMMVVEIALHVMQMWGKS